MENTGLISACEAYCARITSAAADSLLRAAEAIAQGASGNTPGFAKATASIVVAADGLSATISIAADGGQLPQQGGISGSGNANGRLIGHNRSLFHRRRTIRKIRRAAAVTYKPVTSGNLSPQTDPSGFLNALFEEQTGEFVSKLQDKLNTI